MQTSAAEGSNVVQKSSKLFAEGLKIKVVSNEHPSQPFKADAPVFKYIYDRTGAQIELETFPLSDWDQKARTLIATNNLPDIMLHTPGVMDYAASGVFLAVSDYIDTYAPNFKKLAAQVPEVKSLYFEGKLYSFPMLSRYINLMGRVPMIREDMLKKLNLKVPSTFDELFAVLKKFKETNPVMYPMANRNKTGNLVAALAYPLGSGASMYYDKDVNGGKWLYGPAHTEFKEVLSYLSKLYADKILDPDYAIATAQQWQEKLGSGKASFFFDNPSFALNFNAALAAENPQAKFAPMPSLKNSKGEARNFYYPRHQFEHAIISAKVKNPEKIVAFVDWMYSEEGGDITNFGLEGKDFTKMNGEYNISKELVEKHKKDSDPWRGYLGETGLSMLGFCIYIDDRNQFPFISDEQKSWYALWKNDKAMDDFVFVGPPLNKEEKARYVELSSKVNTLYEGEVDKFIMGVKPVSAYDQLIEQLIKVGAAEMENIYNTAAARVK